MEQAWAALKGIGLTPYTYTCDHAPACWILRLMIAARLHVLPGGVFLELPYGVMRGRAALGMQLLETVTHGWDLAKATGQHSAFDPDVVQAASQFTQASMTDERSPGTPFATPMPVADDLSELDRLAAFLRRAP
jgi:hypothetical protein